MALAIVPKSEMRHKNSLTVGFGEVPSTRRNGQFAWALPGGIVTFCKEEALDAARRLDAIIRANSPTKNQLRN